MIRSITTLLFALVGVPSAVLEAQTPPALKPAAPLAPIPAILEAFRTHPIVAIGNVEGGNEQSHAFQLTLIRDPRFAAAANDILVEFGNSLYQETVDRFVRGEDVPYETLRRVWQNTTQIEFEWDLPIYEEFFRAVREVNASLPRERRLRVLLGDPPIDWDSIRTAQDFRNAMGDRDGHAFEVLRREVLAKGRRALVIYGGQHLVRRNTTPGAADVWAGGIVARLEKDRLARAFTILPETRKDLRAQQSDVASWPVPSLAVLSGTPLGAALWDARPQRRAVRTEEQFDAILYLGPPSSMTSSRLSPALCSDRAYREMRTWRLGLIPPPPGAAFPPAEQLKEQCAPPGGSPAVSDTAPVITEALRQLLREAAQGKVSPERIAPESRARLVAFLETEGPRYLGRAGELQSLILLAESDAGGPRVRRYRSVFAGGLKIVWTVGISPEGAIASLTPRPE